MQEDTEVHDEDEEPIVPTQHITTEPEEQQPQVLAGKKIQKKKILMTCWYSEPQRIVKKTAQSSFYLLSITFLLILYFLDEIRTASSTTSPQEPTPENLYTLDMDLDDSDFEQGSDRELHGLFFPEVYNQFF